jgi:ferredoxin-NADP reductase
MQTQVKLSAIKNETHDTRSFIFEKPAEFNFVAGQHLRWRHDHNSSDNRGITRPFSISASPTENFLMFTTKFAPENGSSFKKALRELSPGVEFQVDGPKGEFILPEDRSVPIVFLGGGVGITPFRSIIKWATDDKIPTKLTLIYANKTPGDIIFKREFDDWATKNPNFKTTYTVDTPNEGWTGEVGRMSGEMIQRCVTDLSKPHYFICGPEGMINSYQEILRGLGISEDQIRTENFSGY